MPVSSLEPLELQHLHELAAKLTHHVHESEGKLLSGAQLGLLRQGYADPHGLGKNVSLTRLLDRFAPELTVVGRTGRDLLWGFGLAQDAPDTAAHETQLSEATLDTKGWQEDGLPHWAVFRNYRSLRNVTLELNDLTVLVGANSAGKSNLLDGLFRLSLLTRRKPGTVFRGQHASEHVVGSWAPEDGFTIGLHGPQRRWGFSYTQGDPIAPLQELPFAARAGGEEVQLATLLFTPLGRAFGGALYLQLDSRQLARTSMSQEAEPFLRHDGLYLASVLAHIAATDRDRLARIITDVADVVSAVEDVRILRRRLAGRGEYGHALEVRMRGTGWMRADQLSEGTLFMFGLHTILSRSPAPRLILVDDIERGLHPSAQAMLMRQLRKIAGPKSRIVCTTHSPYILDAVPVAAVRIVIADANTAETHVYNMEDHASWPEWKGHMTAAEFWQFAGDTSWPGSPLASEHG